MDSQIDLKENINQTEPPLSFWEQIKEDWIAHGRDWSKPGFRAVAVHRFGVWKSKIKPQILQLPCRILYGMLYRKIRNTCGI